MKWFIHMFPSYLSGYFLVFPSSLMAWFIHIFPCFGLIFPRIPPPHNSNNMVYLHISSYLSWYFLIFHLSLMAWFIYIFPCFELSNGMHGLSTYFLVFERMFPRVPHPPISNGMVLSTYFLVFELLFPRVPHPPISNGMVYRFIHIFPRISPLSNDMVYLSN